ncbi:hypothetical protein EGW08_017282 [Elysia chlorotica]|uniref:Uncharacterized protein n=1 Tax=Elysia chlorotica TaxID=188477 RepID=A0A3S0ZTJ8_ELYCH|nr:hypothetical protein EGW08_017282 [Elysia chlorotica]
MAEGQPRNMFYDMNVTTFNGASPFEDFEQEVRALLRARPGLSAEQQKNPVYRHLGRDVRQELACQPSIDSGDDLLKCLAKVYEDRRPLNTLKSWSRTPQMKLRPVSVKGEMGQMSNVNDALIMLDTRPTDYSTCTDEEPDSDPDFEPDPQPSLSNIDRLSLADTSNEGNEKSEDDLGEESPARREDFFNVTEASKLPLKFCGHRWLENVPAAERALQIWPAILRYLSAVKKGTVNKPGCKSFLTLVVVDKEGGYLFKAKLHTFIFTAQIAKPFLEKFQADAPLSPFLGADLFALTKRLYSLILTPEYGITVSEASQLKMPKDLPSSAFKQEADFNISHQAEVILKEMKEAGRFQHNVTILSKSPLKYDFANYIQCLDPTVITLEPIKAKKLFKKVAEHLSATKWIQGDEVDQVFFDFETVDRLSQSTVRYSGERLDEFFMEHGRLDSSPVLKKIIQMVLLLSHGNADVESGFSTNKEATVENLLEESLVAKSLICQHVKDNGPLAELPINKK